MVDVNTFGNCGADIRSSDKKSALLQRLAKLSLRMGPNGLAIASAEIKMARIKRAIFVSDPVNPNLVAGIGFEPMTFRL